MARRIDLQNDLEELLGSKEVYFQPPESICLKYPCIVYKRSRIHIRHADNFPYFHMPNYEIEVIYFDPDEDWMTKIFEKFRYVSFAKSFTLNNLHHDVYNLYY